MDTETTAIKRKPKFIYFDVGNVLLSRKIPVQEAWARELGVPAGQRAEWMGKINKNRPRKLNSMFRKIRTVDDQARFFEELARFVLKESGIKESEEMVSKMKDHAMKGEFILDEDAIPVLEHLHKRYKLGIITNSLPSRRYHELEIFGLSKYFDVIIISKETGHQKPSREIFELAIKRSGVNADDILFIDDKVSNVRGARAAGIDNVLLFGRKGAYSKYPCVKRLRDLQDLL